MKSDLSYPYRFEDFYQISASHLRVGHELLLNGPSSTQFAAVPVISVVFPEGGWMMFKYYLPVGMDTSSNKERTVHVRWQGQTPCIEVDGWVPVKKPMYILKRYR